MKMKTYYLLITLILATYGRSYSQANPPIPVTPEAAALSKMVNYPVNHNTGIPDINIPFYEINVGGLKLPITLNYHAGGFKINEQATRAGLGWSLSSDIQITRTINGKDDFDSSYGYLANSFMKRYNGTSAVYPFWSTSPFPYANSYDLATGGRDGSPDKFNYKLLDKSGSFYFLKNSSGSGHSILPVPYDNIKIQYSNGQFIITDTDGSVYYFGEPGPGDLLTTKTEISRSGGSSTPVRTAWKCARIVSATGTDEISFSYVAKTVTTYRSYNDCVEYYSNEEPCGLDEYYTSDAPPMSYTTDYDDLPPTYMISSPKYMEVFANSGISEYHVPYVNPNGDVIDKVYEKNNITNSYPTSVEGLSVSEITFRGGKVVFNGANKLNYIRVLDANNNEVKSMNFFFSYTQATYAAESKTYNGSGFQGTMYLDSLHIKNSTNTFDRYALTYNDKFCYGNHLKGHDAWGYPNHSTMEIAYSDAMGNILSLPTKTIIEPRYYFSLDMGCIDYTTDIPITIGGDDWTEAPHELSMTRGMLKRIVYPTGGSVDFDFEANQYMASLNNFLWEEQVQQLSGGLRIRSINYYEPGNPLPVNQKYYRYGDLEEGTGILLSQPEHVKSWPTGYSGEGNYHLDVLSYDQILVYLEAAYPGGCYDRSCMKIITTEKKTTFEAASAIDYTYSSGAPIYYTKVTEYQQDLGVNRGKIVYEYYEPDEFYDYSNPLKREIRIPYTNLSYLKTDGLIGAQKSVTNYRMSDNQRYKPVHQKNFQYQRYLNPNRIHVAYAFLKVLYTPIGGGFQGNVRELYDNDHTFIGPDFFEDEYIVGEYGIPSAKLLLKNEEEIWFEDAGNHTTTTSYNYDHLPYLQASKITTTDSKGQSISRNIKYPYNFSGTTVYTDMVADNMIDKVIEEIETNVTLSKEVSHTKTNYKKWSVGFNLIAPENIQRSFKGAALVTETAFDQYDAHGNILQTTEKGGLITSYLWGYNNLYPVAVIKGATYASIPTAYKSNVQINNPTNDGSLRTVLNNLQGEYLGIQQVSGYTYKRLVGITSHVSPNGRLTYYEYDGIGRLLTVKDHEQRLVNQNVYSMKGPNWESANETYHANVPLMLTYNTDPSGGGIGVYNHIVPGGKYIGSSKLITSSQAEADVKVMPTPPDGPVHISEHNAEIKLTGEFFDILDAPSWIDVDFLSEGSVVATQRLYPYSGGTYKSTILHIPEGHYEVSMRVDPTIRYIGDIIGYALHIGVYPNSSYYRIHTGESIFFERNQKYNIDATNFDF